VTEDGNAERERLDSALARIAPLLEGHGFAAAGEEEGASSGGAFASATYARGDLKLALVVRHRDRLGMPTYSAGEGWVGHHELVRALGRSGDEQLIEGDYLMFVARDGLDPFAAFASDLESIILPALEASEPEFRAAIAAAREQVARRRGW
jgi:hypothetical protein